MELDKIEKLLARYEEGESSLAEEKTLRDYFLQNEVPDHLRSYKLIFLFAANQSEEKLNKQPEISKRKNWYTWSSVAAILILALGLFLYNDASRQLNENDLGTISNEEVALQKAKETLSMVSQIMNEGKSELVYLKEFNKTTNRIIQID